MKQNLATAIFVLGTAAGVFAQSPTPQQVQQAQQVIQSGAPVTNEMIDAGKAQFPDLQGLSNDQIQQKVKEQQQKGTTLGDKPEDATDATDASAIDGTDASPANATTTDATEDAGAKGDGVEDWVSKKGGNKRPAGFPGAHQRFPAGLQRFGQDFFQNTDLEGLGPNAPALPEYILSPGDELQIYTWGRDSRSQSVTLDKEGMFQFPPLSPMRLAGMKFSDAQRLITEEVEKIHGITASVSLGRLRSIRVMVLGEAVRPGSYAMPAGVTVTSGLFRSGGISDIGSLRNIEVRRGGKVIATLDLYDMLLKGSNRNDIQLLPGDVIFVPLAKMQVAVYGMVKRPAIYEVKAGSGLRALEAVDMAGGLLSNGFKGRVRVDRVQNNKRNAVLDVDMDRVNVKSNVPLEDGDVLFVDKVLDRLNEAVYLEGNVNRPGRYQYTPGMTVRDLIPSLKDLKPETFFEYAQIRRPAPDDERPTLLSFPLADIFSKGTRVVLEPRDVVVIYNRYSMIERPTVTISGTVRRPGTYAFSENMTISDLIIQGGGLGDAYLPEAHLIRVLKAGDSLYTELNHVNLEKILENPFGEENIELRPFDALKVFPRENFMPIRKVSIYGAVKSEGQYEMSENMGIPELVKLAGGLTKNSFTLTVEVARREVVGDSIMTRQVVKLNLKDILEGRSTFILQDGDGIYVREVINSREYSSIVLRGEFNFPGRYEITTGEKLSSVIRRAGGFTPQAYLRGAIFLRQSVKEQQLRHAEEVGRRLEGQLQARLQQATDNKEQAGLRLALSRRSQLLDEISHAPYLGRVLIQIDSKMKFAGTDWDMTLENEDNLLVGSRVSTVSVLGEVSSPTTVIYTRKTNQVGEILAKAGGINTYGDYNETFYIGPDGSITTPRTMAWYSSFKCKSVEPGGTIIVPLKPPAKDYLEIWTQATQILYQIAISVGVAATLF